MNLGAKLQTLFEVTKLNIALQSCSAQEMLGLLYFSSDDAEESFRRSTPDLFFDETGQGSRVAG
jgi:hypothetical protein